MIEKKFNDNWKFWENKDSFALVWNVPETAKEITVPHDAMFENKPHADSLNGGNTGYYDGAFYNYVKTLYAPADHKEKTVILKFEGVYMNAMVCVNGELAGKNMFGYSTFYVVNYETPSNQTTHRIDWIRLMAADTPWFVQDIPTVLVSLANPYHHDSDLHQRLQHKRHGHRNNCRQTDREIRI